MKIAIIGGGAAGFFSAIAAKENYPDAKVVIFEKAQKVLAKVKISGGGRCNLTNGCDSITELCNAYPRGGKSLKKAFHVFNNKDTMHWFESRGVPLVVQSDNCVFPVSQDSQSIIDCFLREAKRLKIEIKTGMGVKSIHPRNELLELKFMQEDISPEIYDKIIVTKGGSPKRDGLNWLENLNHEIENPVPSLFSFKMSAEPITQLMGIVVENTQVSIQRTKIKSNGPLLITHWGMSGPAILKLSSFGARELSAINYHFKIQVNWANEQNNEIVINDLNCISKEYPNKFVSNIKPYGLQERLWLFLLEKIEIPTNKKWNELGKKGLNKLTEVLTNDIYSVNGKSTYKEEFVTCGGVSLQSIDLNTMQSKTCKNIYFAGEVLDIDAITGGFNLQAAWTTGFIAGKLG
ncbi:MAG: NAD(P)/FAD-dependent oxidoreductase [Bacteroidales bacterium]|jgi:predicted Rossmann fold flavoprotein|nr:NAD(P)/FAD-dependent oxidoreductase [Bacteroidales bacterium]